MGLGARGCWASLPPSISFILFDCYFEIVLLAQADLEHPALLLPPSPECWDSVCTPPHLAYSHFGAGAICVARADFPASVSLRSWSYRWAPLHPLPFMSLFFVYVAVLPADLASGRHYDLC